MSHKKYQSENNWSDVAAVPGIYFVVAQEIEAFRWILFIFFLRQETKLFFISIIQYPLNLLPRAI